jgi:drug/metabolite transporter (DMT)-like permease
MLAFNQVVVKVSNDGFGPMFQAGIRSAGALVFLYVWMSATGRAIVVRRRTMPWGLFCGVLFGLEFMCLFTALDLTTVSRASIILYSMPVWLALASHFLIPGERLSGARAVGLALAMGGVVLALVDRDAGGGSFLGDVLALGAALCWAGIALCLRLTPFSEVRPDMQLMYQLVVSAIMLLLGGWIAGDMLRAPEPLHWAGLSYQIVAIGCFGFLFWLWLMTIYKASGVASFAFLSPVLAVLMGWLILGEDLAPQIWLALALVAGGLVLINRK